MSSLRGHRKLDAIRDLAMNAAPKKDLCEKYGVAQPTLYKFSQDFATEIELVRNALIAGVEDETVGLWIASKANRIAEYQEDVDRINELLEVAFDDRIVKIKHNALRAVAEELAQLPQRTTAPQVDQNVVHYSVVGITTNDLKDGLT